MQEKNVSEWHLEMNTDEKTKYSLLNRLIVNSVMTDGLQSSELFCENSQSLNARTFTLFCGYIVLEQCGTGLPPGFWGSSVVQIKNSGRWNVIIRKY